MGENRNAPLWWREHERAQRTVASVSERARERIGHGVYSETDASNLVAAMASGDDAFGRLSLCIHALAEERPSLAVEAWHNVAALFDAAFTIGGLSTISNSADDRVLVYEGKVRKPKRMRDAKQATVKREDGSLRIGTAERKDALNKAILYCVDNDTTRLSSYADKLNPAPEAVRAALPNFIGPLDRAQPYQGARSSSQSWPSNSTVRTAIRGIKKVGR